MTERETTTSIPLIPFDPRQKGPMDVARDAYSRAAEFADENSRVLLAVGGLVLLGAWHYDVGLPRVPNWVLVALLAFTIASPTAWVVFVRLARALHTKQSVLLSEQNAATGDQRLIEIAPDRFEDLRVVSHNGNHREDRSYLHDVYINGRRAYEVDQYFAEANVAVASWQAGVSNSEMRRERAKISEIKTDLEREADKALELLANSSSIIRKQVREVSNRVIEVAEEVETPGDAHLHEALNDGLEEDPAEALLADRRDGHDGGDADGGRAEQGEPDVEDLVAGTVEPDPNGDVYERAAAQMADTSDVATDGGERQ
jgi:hypothetical protein